MPVGQRPPADAAPSGAGSLAAAPAMDRVPRDPGRGGRRLSTCRSIGARPDGPRFALRHPNVMVANTTHDSRTPLANALSIRLQIPDRHLPIADVDGHRSLISPHCAFAAVARFLADPRSVATTTPCQNRAIRQCPGSHSISISGPASRQPWLRRTAVQR